MRWQMAMMMSAALVWTCATSDASWSETAQQQTSGAGGQEKAAPAETVKAVAACGFCLEDGTKVPLELGRELSSGKESTGNRVDFAVTEEVRVQDVVVIPKGSTAYGTIVEARARRRLGRAGKLNVRIEEVRLADGERAKLRAMQENTGKGRQGVMTAAMIGTGILFFPVAPVFLFMRGKDIVIAKGTPVNAYIDGNTELEAGKFGVRSKPAETVAPGASPSAPPAPGVQKSGASSADATTEKPAAPPAQTGPPER